LIAARKGDDELAAQYLNTHLQGKPAADLARQLFVVIDRRLPPRLNELSDKPEGSLSNLLKPDQELVGTISSVNGNVDIFVERVDGGNSGSVWLFSSKTLDSIPDLYEESNVASLHDVLPGFLVNTRFAGIALFEWVAVLVGMPLFYFLAVLLNRLLNPLMGLLRRRLYRKPDLPNPEVLPRPIRLLLLALLIRWIISKVNLPLLARQFWSSTVSFILIAGCVWLLIHLNAWGEELINRRLRRRNITGATSILRLGRRVIDLLVIFVGLLLTLYHFGVNPTAELGALGVGGIAVALAAQKTLENIVGGISLIFDQALRAGDVIKVGDTQGTVVDIGLRSTRIRALDRTMVSVPNGLIANLTVENFSSRDKFLFHPILSLHCGTTSLQMHTVLDHIRRLLEESQQLEPDTVRVRFLRFGPSSLDVEVFAYILARDWSQFLEIQERLLLGITECIESAGVQIAIPFQTIRVSVPAFNDADGQALIKAPAPDWKPSDDAASAKSAERKRSSP
jgi:MscS family membrane protein